MHNRLTRYWWVFVLRGVTAILFGGVALLWPDITLLALVVIFGAYALIDGVSTLVSVLAGETAAGEGRALLVVEGLAGLAIGLMTLLWPDATGLVLLWLVAAWALITGASEVAAALRVRNEAEGWLLLAGGGVLSVLFGIFMMAWPTAAVLTVGYLVGVYAAFFGAALISLGLRLRRRSGRRPPSRRMTPSTPAPTSLNSNVSPRAEPPGSMGDLGPKFGQ
jgi:uncharacterized membrane protein HdeD (DUF308 family)